MEIAVEWFLVLALMATALSLVFVGKRMEQLVAEGRRISENLEATKATADRALRMLSSLRAIIPAANPPQAPHNNQREGAPPAPLRPEPAPPMGSALGIAASLISSFLSPRLPRPAPDHAERVD